MNIKTYRFYFALGVPVYDWPTGKKVISHKFRNVARNIIAYSLTESTERLAKAVIQKYSAQAKLNLSEVFVSVTCSPRVTHKEDWTEINLDEATFAAFVVGTHARALLTPQEKAAR